VQLLKASLALTLCMCIQGCVLPQRAWKPRISDVRVTHERVEAFDEQFVTAVILFENLSKKAVELPQVAFDQNGVGRPSAVSFRVLRQGKWVNPGTYYDIVPVWTEVLPQQQLRLRVRVPRHLIRPGEVFCVGVWKYFSMPLILDMAGGISAESKSLESRNWLE